jgi:thaumarchaeosortase
MQHIENRGIKAAATFKKLLPILSFIPSFLILYNFYPASFETTWKGRTYYLFFLWLISLETILSWEELNTEKWKTNSIKTIPFIATLALPTIYVVAAKFYGFNAMIVELALKYDIGQWWADLMPLSIEYLVFTVFFALILLLQYEISDLQSYAISIFFLGLIGMIYIADNLYPNGEFAPFQIVVPTTATLAANVLNYMGYQTIFLRPVLPGVPRLDVSSSTGSVCFDIGWPCAGVDSLLIYSVTILLFLKKSAIPVKHRIIYFLMGAIVTYFINILRIVTIFVIAINGGDWRIFHDYYGQLYSIAWIVSYPLLIIGTRALWGKLWKDSCSHVKLQLFQQNLV